MDGRYIAKGGFTATYSVHEHVHVCDETCIYSLGNFSLSHTRVHTHTGRHHIIISKKLNHMHTYTNRITEQTSEECTVIMMININYYSKSDH